MTNNETTTTIDHNEIHAWVEARHGFPAAVTGTGNGKFGANFDPGELRIDLPDDAGEDELTPLSWEDWFGKFDREGLAFRYSPDSTFYKLVTG